MNRNPRTFITSRKHPVAAALGAPALISALLLSATPALAETTALDAAKANSAEAEKNPEAEHAASTGAKRLREVRVESGEGAPASDYKAERSSSPKQSQPLVNTAQTLAVVKKELLQEQAATTLSEALRNTPGVTMLLGENGNTATGDSIFMRGFDTQGSIFVDGIRDLGSIARDTFNTEQVEIAKGPAGIDYGRGAASGYVNMASKLPLRDQITSGTLAAGDGDFLRATVDVNHQLGASSAVRVNVLKQDAGVAGRDHVESNRQALAPAISFGLDTATRVHLFALHMEQDNRLDGGVPTIGLRGFYNAAFASGGAQAGKRPARVSTENFYGSLSDFEDTSADMFTVRLEHDLTEGITLRNTARYGKSDQFYVLTGINALSVTDADPAKWTVARSRQVKDQENEILTNQTHLNAQFSTGGITHDLVAGIELLDEAQTSVGYKAVTLPAANLYRPNPSQPGLVQPLERSGVYSDGETDTQALYLFDTLGFGKQFLLTAGLRAERFTTDYNAVALSTATSHPTLPVGTLVPTHVQAKDTLLNWKLGGVYKPAENGSIYLSYATSQQPPGGANFTLSSAASNINNPNMDPQGGSNVELGSKWDLNDGKLAVTAAIYRSVNKNDLTQTDSTSGEVIQYGKKQVQGVELGVVGQLTENWSLSAGLAKMDTEVKQGTATQTGAAISWSPELTFTTWTTYKLPSGLSIGGGARYVDSVVRTINNNANPALLNMLSAPDYWVIDAMASYELGANAALQLNLYNLADEDYSASLNNSGARYIPGTPRSARLTLSVLF